MHRERQGFTLIELIMVIVILGILSSVAVPRCIASTPVAPSIFRRGLPGPCLPVGLRNADRSFPHQRAVMSLQRPARRRGFTLAELVMTIVIMGILIAVTAPRFVSWKGFASRGSYDEA